MMIMTAKVDLKKILLGIAAIAAILLGLIWFLGGDSEPTAAPASAVSGNDGRVQFLKDLGWQVTTSPTQTGQVRIPDAGGEVFERYNLLQKAQGYDLTEYAGKKVMRYVYKINNYPGATEPVYATLLVYKNRIIGGDVTDTAPGGQIRGLQMPAETAPAARETTPATAPSLPENTVPSEG